jgi:uncharacterized protein
MEELGSILLDAAFSGDIAAVQDLVRKGANVNFPDEELGDRPLHRAAMQGHSEVARFLIESGADVNAACNLGSRPLHWAAEAGHMQTVRLLIEKGAQVNAVDSDNQTAADWAASAGHSDIAALLRKLEAAKKRSDQRLR